MVLLELGLNTSLPPVAKQQAKLMSQDMWPMSISIHWDSRWGASGGSFPTDFWGFLCSYFIPI